MGIRHAPPMMNANRLLRIAISLFSCSAPLTAAEPDLRELLRDALYTEEVTRDPEKAAAQYEELLARHDEQKTFAASALFRLAEVRRKQDRKDDAIQLYQRLISEFPSAETEIKLARENLAALGGKMPEAAVAGVDEESLEIARLQKLARTSPDLALNSSEVWNAVKNNRPRVVAFLLESGAGVGAEEPLIWSARRGFLQVLKVLLEKSPGLAGSEGPEALAGAVLGGNIEVVRALLAAKVDMNWQADSCVAPPPAGTTMFPGIGLLGTPLMLAIHLQNQTMIDLLLESGADVKRAANGTGFTALHLAAGRTAKEAPALVERLIQLGADVNALSGMLHDRVDTPSPGKQGDKTSWRISPLQYAVDRGAWACASVLIKHSADRKQASLFDLFVKPEIDDEDVRRIGFLLENGADPNSRDSNGLPVIVHILKQGNVGLLKSFLKHGLDPNLTFTGKRIRHGDPFANNTETHEEYQCPLLASFWNDDKKLQFEQTRILLEAGAKAGPALWSVMDFVAQHDESGEWMRGLIAEAPEVVNPGGFSLGAFERWLPLPKRLVLEGLIVPALAKKPGIKLIDSSTGKLALLAAEGGAETPIITADFLQSRYDALFPNRSELLEREGRGLFTVIYWPSLALHRVGDDGKPIRLEIDLLGDSPLPELRMGDLIELGKTGDPLRKDRHEHVIRNRFEWHIHKRISFPVTLEVNGESREITLRGGLLSYDPTKNEAPLLSAGHLAMLFLPASADSDVIDLKPDSILTVRRQGGEEVRMDLAASGAREFELRSGDHLILPDTESVLQVTDGILRPCKLVIPDFHFARTYHPVFGRFTGDKPATSMPTLIQLLADAFSIHSSKLQTGSDQAMESFYIDLTKMLRWSQVPVVLPHPDFSRIRIRRTGEDGKESEMVVDLAKAIRQCGDDTPDAEARKADLELFPGDRVELPLKVMKPDQTWNGLTPEEERFFRKALAGTVTVRNQDGIIETIAIRYHQPEWMATPHGLIPLVPANGVATPRFFELTGMSGFDSFLKRDGFELGISLANPLLRSGDEIRGIRADPNRGQSQKPARPRIVRPPTPNSD